MQPRLHALGGLAGSLLLLLLLGAVGWRWSYAWRYEAMPSSLAPFWVLVPYLLPHAESFSGPRLPLDGLFLTYAALTLVSLCSPPPRMRLRPEVELGPRTPRGLARV